MTCHNIGVVCITEVSMVNTSTSKITIDNDVSKFKYNLQKTDIKWLVIF